MSFYYQRKLGVHSNSQFRLRSETNPSLDISLGSNSDSNYNPLSYPDYPEFYSHSALNTDFTDLIPNADQPKYKLTEDIEYLINWAYDKKCLDSVMRLIKKGSHLSTSSSSSSASVLNNLHLESNMAGSSVLRDISNLRDLPSFRYCSPLVVNNMVNSFVTDKVLNDDFKISKCSILCTYDELFRKLVLEGNIRLISIILELGVDVRASDDLMLKCAVGNSRLNKVKFLVKKGADIHVNSEEIIKTACLVGNLPMVKFLIGLGSDPRAGGDMALVWAAGKGHLEVVKILVIYGCDVNASNGKPLIWAASDNQFDVVKYLVKLGADIIRPYDLIMEFIISKGYLDMVSILIDLREEQLKALEVRDKELVISELRKAEFQSINSRRKSRFSLMRYLRSKIKTK